MAKPLLIRLQNGSLSGKLDSKLVDDIGSHLKPLTGAAVTESRRKEMCRIHGQFMQQASQFVGRALGKKGLDTQTQADWLAAARHLLGGLMVIAPYTKPPLQLEKLAMGLIRTHLDARRYAEVQPHIDALITHLTEAHGRPSDEDCRNQRKALERLPSHREHAAGRCTRCCELAPRPDSDGGICVLALASLQARMACVIGHGNVQTDELVCCSCANLRWIERADTVDVQLARRSRGRLVRMLHEASSQQIRRGDRTTMPFYSSIIAIDVIMLASTRPENVGMRDCVDLMIKADELIDGAGAADQVLNGYKQAIGCVTASDAARNSWAVVECFRLVERYATLCGKKCARHPEQMWKTFIDWCQPRSTGPTPPVNMLIHAAGALHLSLSELKQKRSGAADWLRKSADLVHCAQDACFEDVPGCSGQPDEPPSEYYPMLRMVIPGGVLVRFKDLALELVQRPAATGSAILLAIEAVMTRVVDILNKACQWEQKTKLPVKFGKSQLVRFRLGCLHAASVARMEHGLLESTGTSSRGNRKTKKRSADDARESMEAALSHLRAAAAALQAVGPGNPELMRIVASFSYNTAVRLSSCERNEEAIQALTLSCEQLQACRNSNEDVNQALCARWTLFAECKDKMEDTGGIVECLKDVVMQVGASLPTDPSADRTFFAPLVFQHAFAYLKPCTSNQVAEPKGKGTAKANKIKSKSTSNKASTDEKTQGRMLTQFLQYAGEQIDKSRFGIILEEYLVQVDCAGCRLKLSTEGLRLAIIDELLLVYDKNDENVTQQLGRARALLHKAKIARAAGKLPNLESASTTVASAIELLAGLTDSVKKGSAEHRHLLEHVAITHAFQATVCTEQQAMRSTNTDLSTTAEDSYAAATAAFSELILAKEGSFCDIEEVWVWLQMLSDYCRLMGDQAKELHFLRLRLRVVSSKTLGASQANSQCESSVLQSDRVTVLSEASMLHTRLGFSEQGVALADEALKESLKMTACMHLERANALACFAKALGHCRSALHSKCALSVQELLHKHSAQHERSWSAVDACGRYVLAEALWVNGDRLQAAQVAMCALQVRVGLAPGCQDLMVNDDKAKPVKNNAAQSIHDGEDPQDLDVQVGNAKSMVASTKAAGTTFTWGALHNLLESLLQAGSYASRTGRGEVGEAYLHKALNIADRLSSNSWKARIQCVLAELHYLRHDDRYKVEVQPAIALCNQHTLEYIGALAVLVDFFRKSGDQKTAISKCEDGLRNLEVMRHPKFLKEQVYKISVANKSYSVVDEIGICGQQPSKLAFSNDTEVQPCLFPYQLEQAHAMLELKQGQLYCRNGDNKEATKLFKRALTRTGKHQPLQAIALYHLGCQHNAQCSAKEETIAHKWSLHTSAQSTVKSTTRKGRGRKLVEDGPCISKQFRTAQEFFEQALSIAIAHDMAGLASKLCHRLAAMHGRQAQASCCILQASLCVPLSSHMQSLLLSQGENHEIPDVQAVTNRFCVNALVSASAEHFQEQYVDKLAPDWSVCSCTVDYTDDGRAALFVSRMASRKTPIVVRIPMGEDSDGKLNLLRTLTTNWDDLIQRNIDSLQGGAKTTAKEKKAWWDRRSELDDDMKTCLQRLEQSWLGGFKGLLLGQPISLDESETRARAMEVKSKVFGTCEADPLLVELVLSSADALDDEELQQVCTDILVGQVGSFREDQEKSTCELAKLAAHEIRQAFDDLSNGAGQPTARGPTILLLGQEVQQLPWESLPCFRRCGQSVTRMPGLPFVLSRHVQPGGHNWLWHVDPGVHPNRTFYVLNPAGDLVTTQETFEEAFSNRHEWEGFAGTAPSCDAYKTGLQTKDLFIYCGHGTGERYLSGSDLAKLGRCAVTMLMGCSSGKLRKAGTFGVEGMPLSYVLAGCPALVANLWDVTDKDIDKFSNTLLETWVDGKGSKAGNTGESKDRSLPEELPQAREACKFLYLNGAAPVCYGVPCVPVAVTT